MRTHLLDLTLSSLANRTPGTLGVLDSEKVSEEEEDY